MFKEVKLPIFADTMTTSKILQQIPKTNEVFSFIYEKKFAPRYLTFLKALTNFSDEKISNFLNINVKTFRSYKSSRLELKKDLQEHTIMLLSLIKHGIDVFGSQENFMSWLEKENFYLDKKAPILFLDTINGISLVNDALTGMEYGDNA